MKFSQKKNSKGKDFFGSVCPKKTETDRVRQLARETDTKLAQPASQPASIT